jgi:transposase
VFLVGGGASWILPTSSGRSWSHCSPTLLDERTAKAALGGPEERAQRHLVGAAHRRNRKRRKTQDGRRLRRYRRRWTIERLFAWLGNYFRRLVVRYERQVENYLGFVQLGCAVILLRQL